MFPEVEQTIRQVREAKGWDTQRLAQQTCLSERQVRQLEGEPGDSFYSDQIRVLAAKRVLCRLGWAPEQVSALFTSGHGKVDTTDTRH